MKTQPQIPTVQFYGEQSWQPTQDYLHCEPLITRSRAHQFQIRPHRHAGMTQVFHLRSGSGTANIDGVSHRVEAPMLIVISPLSVHDFLWSDDVGGTVVSISTPRLERSQQSLERHTPVLAGTAMIRLDTAERALDSLLEMLLREYRRAPDSARDRALQSLVDLLVIEIERLHQESAGGTPRQHRRSAHFQQYLELVNRDYRRERSLEAYADRLGISAPYLNQLCKELTGRNALQILHERILLEAQRLLTYTALRINEVADQLGFSDPAYFTRFFRRLSGVSPRQYRQRQQPGA